MINSLEKASENYKKLRAKFLELHNKCNVAEKAWTQAAEAAGMAYDALAKAEDELLAASAGLTLDEFKAESCLCDHHSDSDDPDDLPDDFFPDDDN